MYGIVGDEYEKPSQLHVSPDICLEYWWGGNAFECWLKCQHSHQPRKFLAKCTPTVMKCECNLKEKLDALELIRGRLSLEFGIELPDRV